MANTDNQENKIPFEPKEMKIIENTQENYEEHKERMEELIVKINKRHYENDASLRRIKSRTLGEIIQIRGVQVGKRLKALIGKQRPSVKKKIRRTTKTNNTKK